MAASRTYRSRLFEQARTSAPPHRPSPRQDTFLRILRTSLSSPRCRPRLALLSKSTKRNRRIRPRELCGSFLSDARVKARPNVHARRFPHPLALAPLSLISPSPLLPTAYISITTSAQHPSRSLQRHTRDLSQPSSFLRRPPGSSNRSSATYESRPIISSRKVSPRTTTPRSGCELPCRSCRVFQVGTSTKTPTTELTSPNPHCLPGSTTQLRKSWERIRHLRMASRTTSRRRLANQVSRKPSLTTRLYAPLIAYAMPFSFALGSETVHAHGPIHGYVRRSRHIGMVAIGGSPGSDVLFLLRATFRRRITLSKKLWFPMQGLLDAPNDVFRVRTGCTRALTVSPHVVVA